MSHLSFTYGGTGRDLGKHAYQEDTDDEARVSNKRHRPDKTKSGEPRDDGDNADPNPIVVEFKFRSCETKCVQEGDLTGVLHVPMLQDPLTGRFTVPPGTTEVKAIIVKKTRLRIGYGEDDYRYEIESSTENVIGQLERNVGQPIKNFVLGYDLTWDVAAHVEGKLAYSFIP
eukprot:scaffold16619_cov32-Attheya_sp.AAC.1